MRSRKIEEYKKKLKLTKTQREILIGLMLGDGHLETQNQGRTYRLKIEHSFKQKDYTDWLYGIWKDWTLTPPQTKKKVINKKIYTNYYFNTVSHGAFHFYGNQFYQGKRKVVPKLIHQWLTPRALAIWFMDDGSVKSRHHHARILNTQGFTYHETSRLAHALESVFRLTATLREQAEGYQIMIAGSSSLKFRTIINRYIIPSMRYKIPPHRKRLTLLPKV